MPCNDYGRDQYESGEKTKEIAELTALLCEACAQLELHNVLMPATLDAWWQRHQVEDERRRADQARNREYETARLRRIIQEAQDELRNLE